MTRRRKFLATVAGAGSVTLAGCEDLDLEGELPDEHASGDDPTLTAQVDDRDVPIFDPEYTHWWSYRNMSEHSLHQRDQRAHDRGMMMVEIGYDEIREGYYGIWHENVLEADSADERDWEAVWGLDTDEFGDKWDEMEDDYRLIDQTHYYLNGERRYAGVWIDNVGGIDWTSHRNSAASTFEDRIDSNEDDMHPLSVEGYEIDAGMRYAACWVENADDLDWSLQYDLTDGEFGTENSQRRSDGYRLLDYDGYLKGGDRRWVAVWIDNVARDPALGAQDEDVGGTAWGNYRNMSSARYGQRLRMMVDRGYRPTKLTMYEEDGETRIAGVWRQNARRTTWSKRHDVDEEIEDFIDEQDLPGVSVAIMRDGVALYRRGFTNTDVSEEGSLSIDSRSTFRLASVSKPLGTVLAFRLQQAGEIDLDEETIEYVPDMPPHQEHTVAELLANRGCVQGYNDHEALPTTREYDFFQSATTASAAYYGDPPTNDDLPGEDGSGTRFWEVPLIGSCSPGGSYSYTTHGFSFAGAALEGATGTQIDELIENALAGPTGLHSFVLEDRTEADSHRVPIYDNQNDRLKEWPNGDPLDTDAVNEGEYVDSNSWSALGAGIEGHVYDLARFGDMVLRDQLMSPDTKAEMLDESVNPWWTYTHGWNVITEEIDDIDRRHIYHGGRQQGGNARIMLIEAVDSDEYEIDETDDDAPTQAELEDTSDVVIAALSNRIAVEPVPDDEDHRPDSVSALVEDLIEQVDL